MEKIQDKIIAYLHGKLSADECAEFEKQIENDEDLQAEVKFFKELDFVFGKTDLLAVGASLQGIRNEITIEPDLNIEEHFLPKGTPPSGGSGGGWTRWYWWAGSILVMVIAGILLWNKAKLSSYQRVSQEFIQNSVSHYEDVIGIQDQSPLSMAMNEYDKRTLDGYKKAIPLLQQHLKQRKDADDFAVLYLGICHNMLGEATEAIKTLAPLLAIDNKSLANAAKWHTALALLQLGDANRAKKMVFDLQDDRVVGDAAKSLLLRL